MRTLYGYPTSWGNKRACVFPHAGPTTYTPVTVGSPVGTPATGGDAVEAAEAGMKTFDFVVGELTDDGLYRIETFPYSLSSDPNDAPRTTYGLRWVVVATGAEAGAIDLSDSVVRLLAVGPN